MPDVKFPSIPLAANQRMKRIKHTTEYEYWRAHGRNVTRTAGQFERALKTIRKWRDAEDWVEHADEQDMADAQQTAETAVRTRNDHLTDGEKALKAARANFAAFQHLVTSMNSKGLKHIGKNMVDALDIDVIIKANMASARIAAILYPSLLPQHVAVSQAPAPAEELQEYVTGAINELQLVEARRPVAEDAQDEADDAQEGLA